MKRSEEGEEPGLDEWRGAVDTSDEVRMRAGLGLPVLGVGGNLKEVEGWVG